MIDQHAQIHQEIYADTFQQHNEAVALASQLSALADGIQPGITLESVLNTNPEAHADLLRRAAQMLADKDYPKTVIASTRYQHLRDSYGIAAADIAKRYGFTELDKLVDYSIKGVVLVKGLGNHKQVSTPMVDAAVGATL